MAIVYHIHCLIRTIIGQKLLKGWLIEGSLCSVNVSVYIHKHKTFIPILLSGL